ncbi:MAG: hypothetical protein Q7R51_03260 [bacterium]|nr:hypothetical protein [bacterium]
MAFLLSSVSTLYFYFQKYIIAYGDAESHLNIAKRVIHSPTPGFSQLGGIWLPLPHVLMLPFVYFDFLWRTGLAGAIVSGTSFIISCVFLYKLTYLITKNKYAGFLSFIVFGVNPNILYMQSTPMTELLLITFFIVSTYYFIVFLKNGKNYIALIYAAFFGFCATLTRYDGWFLVLIQAFILFIYYLIKTRARSFWEGRLILFSTLAFVGIGLWFLWDLSILGDPLYFLNSPFSAKSQQHNWIAKGELPTYKNIFLSFLYYLTTSVDNIGIIVSVVSIIGLFYYFKNQKGAMRIFIPLLLLTPFAFYVLTLYLGQSVIFEPNLTPQHFEFHLFNTRYGIVMVPFAAFFFAYLFFRSRVFVKLFLMSLLVVQTYQYITGGLTPISLQDGISGLSASANPDAQIWIAKNYDGGYVLLDDYARTISVLRTKIPMQKVIYIGNKPYWDESLETPQKYATWIVMQKDDAVWSNINNVPQVRAELYKYFQKAYTSPDILIFKRNKEIKYP